MCRYLRGGLAERAFWLQVANAGLPPLLRLAAPGRLARRSVFAHFVRTQVHFLPACALNVGLQMLCVTVGNCGCVAATLQGLQGLKEGCECRRVCRSPGDLLEVTN